MNSGLDFSGEVEALPALCHSVSETDSGYVVLQKPYGCGCGKCSYNDFLDGYCPSPNAASTFPCLDMAALSELEKDELEAKLLSDFHRITKEFSKLNEGLCDSFTGRGIPLKKVAVLLQDLRAFPPSTFANAPLLGTHIDMITTDNSIYDIFDILWLYISFFNYQITEHLVNHLGTDYDKVLLCRYKKNLDEYCSRSILECPSFSSPHRHQASFVLKVEGMNQYSIKQLNVMMMRLTEILSIASHSLRLCRLEEGGKKIIFQVPLCVRDKVFPLSAECIRRLTMFGSSTNSPITITLVKCGLFLYKLPGTIHCQKDVRVVSSMETDSDTIYNHGYLSRLEAESILSSVDYNCFLVRQSPNAAGCVIYSYKDYGAFNHVKQEGSIDFEFIHKTEGSACLMPLPLEVEIKPTESESVADSLCLDGHSNVAGSSPRRNSDYKNGLDRDHARNSIGDSLAAAKICGSINDTTFGPQTSLVK